MKQNIKNGLPIVCMFIFMKPNYTRKTIFLCSFSLIFFWGQAQNQTKTRRDNRVRDYFPANRVVWTFDQSQNSILNVGILFQFGNGQADLVGRNVCTFNNPADETTSILLDFGKEIHGGLEIVTVQWCGGGTRKVRIRFGESVG